MELSPKSFNLFDLIKEIEDIFSFRCESLNLNFEIKTNNLPKYIKADEQRLRQILINLLGNSLKFTKEGFISLYVYELNNKLFFEVKDSGIGISKEYQEKIFKPFEQIKKDNYTSEGTGLGLSITKELIALMDGNIYLKSQVGVGSEFYFSINYEKANEAEIKKESSKIEAGKMELSPKSFNLFDLIKEIEINFLFFIDF